MIGYVLAAGFGTRLKPITDMIPKALVPVCGVPLIEVALRYFRKNAIETLCTNVHYQGEVLKMFTDRLPYNVRVFDEQPDILGTGGAIYNAKEFLETDETFAVLNSDIVLNFPLHNYIEAFEKSDTTCVLISTTDETVPSILSDDAGNYCGTVGNQFGEGSVKSSFVGLALYKREALSFFTADDFSVVPVWQRMVEAGKKVEVWNKSFYWKDTGKPEDLFEVYRDVFDKKLSFDFPLGMQVDFDRKIAWGATVTPDMIHSDSSYCWVENVAATKIKGKNNIFFSGVAVDEAREYENSLVLPWCEVSFE